MHKMGELASPSSCFNQSQHDEPLFVLCARDPVAPAVVEHWAAAYKAHHEIGRTFTPHRELKVFEALELAQQMRKWRKARETDGNQA